MRYRDILLEFDLKKTIANYGSALIARYRDETQQRHPGTNDKVPDTTILNIVMDWITRVDPTPKKAYVLDLIRWYLDGSMRFLEDAGKAKEGLALYAKFRNRGLTPLKDMNFTQFLDYGDELAGEKSRSEVSKDEEQGFYDRDEAHICLDTPSLKILDIYSEKASKFFGRNTRWCTASNEDNMFDHYIEDGAIYIILFKGQGAKKWQFHFQDHQFMNERDENITREEAMKEPEVLTYFRDQFIDSNTIEYVINPDDLPNDKKQAIIRYYGPNIEYFQKPDKAMVLNSLSFMATKWSFIAPEFRKMEEIQLHALDLSLDFCSIERYYEFVNPSEKVTKKYEQGLKSIIREITGKTMSYYTMKQLGNRAPKTVARILDSNLLSVEDMRLWAKLSITPMKD